jgi:hypothetical protein
MAMPDRFDSALLSRHAIREARRERIPTEMIAATDDPDERRQSELDDLREVRDAMVW